MTMGELVHPQLSALGVADWQIVEDDIKEHLARTGERQRAAFAAASAEHLWRPDERPPEVRGLTISPRSVLDQVWETLIGEGDRRPELQHALWSFNEVDVADENSEADEDAVAATVYAAEALIEGKSDSAFVAARRLIDHAFSRAADALGPEPPELMRWWALPEGTLLRLTEEARHPIVQSALQQLENYLSTAEADPLTPEIALSLRERSAGRRVA
ncbi:MAG: hypothetical protein ACREN2_11950 [Candidatus Dormibacteria bacterium]